jgi:hypothetical protein
VCVCMCVRERERELSERERTFQIKYISSHQQNFVFAQRRGKKRNRDPKAFSSIY